MIGPHSLHLESNENGIKAVGFATAMGLSIMSTYFTHKCVYKKHENQIDHVMIEKRPTTDITDIRSFRGADCSSEHFIVIGGV